MSKTDEQEGAKGATSRRRFSAEFKVEAVRMASSGERSVAEVARELGVNPEVLRTWKRRMRTAGGRANGKSGVPSAADAFPGNGKLTSTDEELRQLRRENAVLREERDILKKATVFFARDAR